MKRKTAFRIQAVSKKDDFLVIFAILIGFACCYYKFKLMAKGMKILVFACFFSLDTEDSAMPVSIWGFGHDCNVT